MKIYAYLAAALLLAGLLGAGVHIVRKASRVDVAEARAEAAEKGRASDMAEVVKRLDDDKAWREGFGKRFDAIDQKFAGLKIPTAAELVQSKEVPSVEGKCIADSVGPTFVGLFNEASEPPRDPAPVTR